MFLQKRLLGWTMIAVLAGVGISSLYAQTAGTGALTGTVTDPAGAVVPNVAITAINSGNGQERSAASSSDGRYTIGLLPPGSYMVRFSAPGFKTAEVGPVTITVTE